MPGFDDLPAGAAVPPLDDAARAAVQHVQNTGESLLLARLDEAELIAVGLGNQPRQGRPAVADAEVLAAADRLVNRRLGEHGPWAAGPVRPAAGLLLYAQLALHPRAHLGFVQGCPVPEGPQTQRTLRRISVLTDVLGGGLACVETSLVPAHDPPASVPVVLELVRLDVLVAQVVAEAFVTTSGAGRETVVAFADAAGALVPSRFRVDAAGRGELEARRAGVLGTRTKRNEADSDALADHLRARLVSAR